IYPITYLDSLSCLSCAFLFYPPASSCSLFFFFNDPATTEIYTLSLHDALPIWNGQTIHLLNLSLGTHAFVVSASDVDTTNACVRSEEHTSELQSPYDLVCRLLLEKKKKHHNTHDVLTINMN